MKRKKPLGRKPPQKKGVKRPKATSEKSLRARADKVAGSWFRAYGRCVACGEGSFACDQVIQWCHIVRRGCRLIRHDPRNALPMCRSHHVWFTHRPELWYTFVERLDPGRLQLLVDVDTARSGERLVDVYQGYLDWYAAHESYEGWDGWLH